MKVLHLSTTGAKGGAGRAAHRLHAALRKLGVDSQLLSTGGLEPVPPDTVPVFPRAFELEMAQAMLVDSNRTPLSNTLFSLGLPGPDFRQHPAWLEADVIHLHWVTGLLSVPAIGQVLAGGKPVVWTFHDQWSFTGGCHYSAGCDHYRAGCHDCPQLDLAHDTLPAAVHADKQALWAQREKITLVALTAWMEGCIKQSSLFATTPVRRIANGLDLALFAPARRAAARQALGLKADTILCLFVSQSVHELRKGFGVLKEALALAVKNPGFQAAVQSGRLVFASLGHHHDDTTAVPLKHLSWSDDEAAIADCYAAADVFLAPSLEDNLPNTVAEALACGTPVIGAAAGGIPEMVTAGQTGLLVPAGDAAALAEALLDFHAQPARFAAMRAACRADAEKSYSDEANARKMAGLYEELTRATGRPPATATPPPAAAAYGPAMEAFLAQPAPGLPAGAWTKWAAALDKEWRELTTALTTTKAYLGEVQKDRDASQQAIRTAQAATDQTIGYLKLVEKDRDEVRATLQQTVAYLQSVEKDSADRLTSITTYQGKLKEAYGDLERNVAYLKTLEAEIQAHIKVAAERDALIASLSAQVNAAKEPRP